MPSLSAVDAVSLAALPLSIRTEDLRKVYTSPPPAATPGRGLTPAFGGARKKEKIEIVALDSLTLEVRPGEIFGLLGPNGAGKSTTVGILTTRIRPTGGRAWIGDADVWKKPVAVKPLIGVVPQRPNLDFSLTVREILTFHGAYFDFPRRNEPAARESSSSDSSSPTAPTTSPADSPAA
jgi:ABC-2 type transport system ATP-binding protein